MPILSERRLGGGGGMVVVNNNGSVGSFCLSLYVGCASVIFLAPKTGWCDRESHLSLSRVLLSVWYQVLSREHLPSELIYVADMICKHWIMLSIEMMSSS